MDNPVLITTPWTELSGLPKPNIEGWQKLIIFTALVLMLGPFIWWNVERAKRWRWWRSALFLIAWASVGVLVGVGVGQLSGDTRVRTEADDIVAQLLATMQAELNSMSAVSVDPSQYSTNSTVLIPYQGDRLVYHIGFTAESAGGPVRCQATMAIARKHAPKGPVFARLAGWCSTASD